MKKVKLNNGLEMPMIGLGTFPMKRLELFKAVYCALRSGYTSFDTASAYANEAWLGISLKLLGLMGLGKSLFLTTKLSNTEQRHGDVRAALLKSLRRLKVDCVDLYLMHWPNPDTYIDCWKQMEELYDEGLVKAIGVCNFHQHHLECLLEKSTVTPAVNQIELHPLLSQKCLRSFCKKMQIQVEAYSPVARMAPKLIESSTLNEIAFELGKTVPQIIFRWAIQHGIVVIPKSANADRIQQNISVFDFELNNSDMMRIDGLNEDFRVRHNPDTADLSKL